MLLTYWLYKYFFKQKTSTFWHRQPIHSDKYGLIQPPASVEVKQSALQLLPDESWVTPTKKELGQFLAQHYEKDLQISHQYQDWLQQYIIFGIKKAGRLIATIGAAPTTFSIGGETRRGYYVDILCIDRQYRKSGYAPKLIEKLIEMWKETDMEIMLFKLDNMQIGPHPTFTFQYYMLDTTTIQMPTIQNGSSGRLEMVDRSNIVKAYEYFQSQMGRYEIVEEMTLKRFKRWILNPTGITTSYLMKRGKNRIVGFVNLMKNKYRKATDAEIVEVVDVIYCLGNKLEIMPLLLEKLSDIRYYIFLDIMDHKDLISLYQMKPLYTTNYYFYNYELLKKYEPTDVGINRF